MLRSPCCRLDCAHSSRSRPPTTSGPHPASTPSCDSFTRTSAYRDHTRRLPLRGRAPRSRPRLTSGGGDTFTVLGAGSDDLEAGRAYLGALADAGLGGADVAGGVRRPRRDAGGGRDRAPRELGELRRARPVPVPRRARARRADAARARHARAVRALAAGDRAPARRSGASCSPSPAPAPTSPGLSTRARRRRRRVARARARRCGRAGAHTRSGGCCSPAHDPSVPKHAGITAFGSTCTTPGVDVRPLRQMNGDAHFTEVFLDDAAVPDADRIGAAGEGWRVARHLLVVRARRGDGRRRAAGCSTSTGSIDAGPPARALRVDPRRARRDSRASSSSSGDALHGPPGTRHRARAASPGPRDRA